MEAQPNLDSEADVELMSFETIFGIFSITIGRFFKITTCHFRLVISHEAF